MLDKNKEAVVKCNSLTDDPLMKPFALGWTREVVNRVVTKNRSLNCDIYYFNPSGKKIRSLTEIRSNLTDGLTPECFSFKRQPLGVNETYETVRNARVRRKGSEYLNGSSKSLRGVQKTIQTESASGFNSTDLKKKTNSNSVTSKKVSEVNVNQEVETDLPKKNVENENEESDVQEVNTSRKVKNSEAKSAQDKNFNTRKKTKTKAENWSARAETAKRRVVLKRLMATKQAKQAKVAASKKIFKKIMKKKVAGSPKHQLSNAKRDKPAGLKNKNLNTKINLLSKKAKVPLKRHQARSKLDLAKEEGNTNEIEKKPSTRDLRSIVKKNIGKYREMREKQKLAIKSQIKNIKSRISVRNISRTRSEPISKNEQLYLKPFERGWRRELVYRTNCARAGQHADVYYFHPNGKKLRSRREISENLTQGLTIEYFTFRKESIGCGEPYEVIRKARRSLSKSSQSQV